MPFPFLSILALIACAASLCNPFYLHELSRSDLNQAWLLHGRESVALEGETLVAAQACAQPSASAPCGFFIWVRRRVGDFAALAAVLSYMMPAPEAVSRSPQAYRQSLSQGGLRQFQGARGSPEEGLEGPGA